MASLKVAGRGGLTCRTPPHQIPWADGVRDHVVAQGVDRLVRQVVGALTRGRERHDGDRLVGARPTFGVPLEESGTGGGL